MRDANLKQSIADADKIIEKTIKSLMKKKLEGQDPEDRMVKLSDMNFEEFIETVLGMELEDTQQRIREKKKEEGKK